MRLTLKLTLALTLVLAVQFTLYGYLVAERLTGFFERDIIADTLQIGRALSVAVTETWRTRGINEARAIVVAANSTYDDIQIRFVWLSGTHAPEDAPETPLEKISDLKPGGVAVKHVYPQASSDLIYTYIVLPHPGDNIAALELRQSYAPETWFTIVSVLRVVAFLVVVVLTTSALMLFLGVTFIGRPIRRLCDKARRIGAGDLSGHLEISGTDEIAQLAHEINLMSDQLLNSRRLLEEETAARISAIEALRHDDRLKTIGTLASGVAHELGTPLTVAGGHVNLLTAANETSEREKIKQSLSEQLHKMAGIVQQLLNFSRRRSLEKHTCDLNQIISRVVTMLTPFSQKRNVKLSISEPPSRTEVEADETQLEQVFTNLLINAIQASDGGTVSLETSTVSIANPEQPAASPTLHHCIEVKDLGIGMNAEQIKQIFDPFFTTKEPGHGTGMGLSIAHGIVQEHHGWIKVRSEAGKGSCFSVYLPYRQREQL